MDRTNYRDRIKSIIGEDILIGAEEIAEFIYGDRRRRRAIYYLAESGQLPVFRIGKRGLRARRSTLRSWVDAQERAACPSMQAASGLRIPPHQSQFEGAR